MTEPCEPDHLIPIHIDIRCNDAAAAEGLKHQHGGKQGFAMPELSCDELDHLEKMRRRTERTKNPTAT